MESFRFRSEMYCEILVEEKLAETVGFLSLHEERCITLMSRLVKNGVPVMPEENLSVLVFRHPKESSVCAVVSYSESGFIPCSVACRIIHFWTDIFILRVASVRYI